MSDDQGERYSSYGSKIPGNLKRINDVSPAARVVKKQPKKITQFFLKKPT